MKNETVNVNRVANGTVNQAIHTNRMLELYGGIQKSMQDEHGEAETMSPYDFEKNEFNPLFEKATDEQKEKLKKVFDEYKQGQLHSGSKEGPKVTNHKQAVAIALHESGLAKSFDEAEQMVEAAAKKHSAQEKEEQRDELLHKACENAIEKGGKGSGKRKPKEGDPVLFIHPSSKEVVRGKIVKGEDGNKEGMHDVKYGDEVHYLHEDDFIKDNTDKYRGMDDDKLNKHISEMETLHGAEGDKMKKFYMKHELNTAKAVQLARNSKGSYKNLYRKPIEKADAYDTVPLTVSRHVSMMLQTYGHDIMEKAKFSDKERDKLSDKDEAEPDGSYPIRNTSDLHNAIKAYGRSKDKAKTKAWIKKRAKELNAEHALPEDWEKAHEMDENGVATEDDAAGRKFKEDLNKAAGGGTFATGEAFVASKDGVEKSSGLDCNDMGGGCVKIDDKERAKRDARGLDNAAPVEKGDVGEPTSSNSDIGMTTITASMEKSLDEEIVTLHSRSMNFSDFMTKGKEVPIGTVDKARRYVKTAEGWKPVHSHNHLIKHDLEENKRHGENLKHLGKEDFTGNEGSKQKERKHKEKEDVRTMADKQFEEDAKNKTNKKDDEGEDHDMHQELLKQYAHHAYENEMAYNRLKRSPTNKMHSALEHETNQAKDEAGKRLTNAGYDIAQIHQTLHRNNFNPKKVKLEDHRKGKTANENKKYVDRSRE